MDARAARDALIDRRAELAARLVWLTAEFDEIVSSSTEANGDDEHDPEGSTVAFERARVASLVVAAQGAADRLDRALERIDDGDYGRCAACGAAIDPERLVALPAGETCLACALDRPPRPVPLPVVLIGSGHRALVLGGGGIAAIAWQTGLAAAFDRAGVDLSAADVVLGTSAGATVAAQIASTTGAQEWYRRQVDPAVQNRELRPPGLSVGELWEAMLRIAEEVSDPAERRRRVGALALAADTVPESVRRAVVAGRLPEGGWPDRRIAVVAVDALSGQRRVFESGSPVDLVDAVAASSAVPGIWPPVTIGGTRYIDGGIYSSANADLAVGFPVVLIVAPMPDPELDVQVHGIESEGRALVVAPDDASLAAFGSEPLDPEVREPAARAGYEQGTVLAADVGRFWSS